MCGSGSERDYRSLLDVVVSRRDLVQLHLVVQTLQSEDEGEQKPDDRAASRLEAGCALGVGDAVSGVVVADQGRDDRGTVLVRREKSCT